MDFISLDLEEINAQHIWGSAEAKLEAKVLDPVNLLS